MMDYYAELLFGGITSPPQTLVCKLLAEMDGRSMLNGIDDDILEEEIFPSFTKIVEEAWPE